ncbi:MAG: glycosyltransferase, partial [Thermoplasmata archaeon]
STDSTDDIVSRYIQSDERVKLIRKPKRTGKNDSIKVVVSLTQSDALVLLDADVRLGSENVLEHWLRPIYDGRAVLVGANVIPVNPVSCLSPATLARYFDWLLEDEARRRKPASYWGVYGRAFAMSKDFYRNLVLPSAHADDLFIYYSCKRSGQRRAFAKDAIVYFQAPKSIKDFVCQYSRFAHYTEKVRKEFGKELVDDDMRVQGMTGFLLSRMVRYPLHATMWATCRLASRIAYLMGEDDNVLEAGLYKTESRRVGVENSPPLVRDRSCLGETAKLAGQAQDHQAAAEASHI